MPSMTHLDDVPPTAGGGFGPPVDITVAINDNDDDAEQAYSSSCNGSISTSSSDLELGTDGSEQVVGCRFTSTGIPAGSLITSAKVQFQARHGDAGLCLLRIYVEDADAPATYTGSDGPCDRTWTSTWASWSVPDWVNGDDRLPAQLTVDFSSVLQGVVNRPLFNGDINVIFTDDAPGDGNGWRRNARSHNNASGTKAADIQITYQPPL